MINCKNKVEIKGSSVHIFSLYAKENGNGLVYDPMYNDTRHLTVEDINKLIKTLQDYVEDKYSVKYQNYGLGGRQGFCNIINNKTKSNVVTFDDQDMPIELLEKLAKNVCDEMNKHARANHKLSE
jgi:hypothetical protein